MSSNFWNLELEALLIYIFGYIIQAMYIRVKRNKSTYFIHCDPTEKVLEIKQKLQGIIDQPVDDQRLILLETGEVLDDSKTLAEEKVVRMMDLRDSDLVL